MPEASKQLLETLETYISAQQRTRDELKSIELGAEVASSSQSFAVIQSDLKSIAMVIEADELVVKDVQQSAERDRADSNTLFEVARNFQNRQADNSHLRMFPHMSVLHRLVLLCAPLTISFALLRCTRISQVFLAHRLGAQRAYSTLSRDD